MGVRMRLAWWGTKRMPIFRIVVANQRGSRDGKYLEKLGIYNPRPSKHGEKQVRLNYDRVKYWLACGAMPSERVEKLLGHAGILPNPPPRVHQTKKSVPKAQHDELPTFISRREWVVRERRKRRMAAGIFGNAGKAKKDELRAARRSSALQQQE